jgi:hypothetical protein
VESPQQKQRRVQLAHQLVQDLQTMRDSLTHLSLMLNDLQFEVDVTQRQAAIAKATHYITSSQSRGV